MPESEYPPVDLETFRAVMRKAGVEEVVDATLAVYLEEAPRIFGRLSSAVASGDAGAVSSYAHSLKSSSGNIHATALSETMRRLEALGREGDLDAIRDFFPEARARFDRVMAYLRQEAR